MVIFGRNATAPTAAFYAYESRGITSVKTDLVSVATGQVTLEPPVV